MDNLKVFTLQGLMYMGKGYFTREVITKLRNPIIIEGGELLEYDYSKYEDKDNRTVTLKLNLLKYKEIKLIIKINLTEEIKAEHKTKIEELNKKLKTQFKSGDYFELFFNQDGKNINLIINKESLKTTDTDTDINKNLDECKAIYRGIFYMTIIPKIIDFLKSYGSGEGKLSHIIFDGYPREGTQLEDFKKIMENKNLKYKHILINPIITNYQNIPITSIECAYSLCKLIGCGHKIKQSPELSDKDYHIVCNYLLFILPRIMGRIIDDKRLNDMKDFNLLKKIYPDVFKLFNEIVLNKVDSNDDLKEEDLTKLKENSTEKNNSLKTNLLDAYKEKVNERCKNFYKFSYLQQLSKNPTPPQSYKDNRLPEHIKDFFNNDDNINSFKKFRVIKSATRGGALYFKKLLENETYKNDILIHTVNQIPLEPSKSLKNVDINTLKDAFPDNTVSRLISKFQGSKGGYRKTKKKKNNKKKKLKNRTRKYNINN